MFRLRGQVEKLEWTDQGQNENMDMVYFICKYWIGTEKIDNKFLNSHNSQQKYTNQSYNKF